MSKSPAITVVIPTHNRPHLLTRAIRSAEAQTGVSFEILVVDDGDGAGLALVAERHQPYLKAISSQRQGQVPARRLGVAAARGRWIAFLDDDDWWEETDHLAQLAAVMPEGPALAYASGEVVVETETGAAIEALPFVSAATPQSLRQNNTLIVSAILFDRDLIAALGPFDETMPFYWDWDFYLRVAASGVPLIGSGGHGVRVSARHGSVSSDANIAARRADLDRLAAKHGLGFIPLRNHESIARDRQSGQDAGLQAGIPAASIA